MVTKSDVPPTAKPPGWNEPPARPPMPSNFADSEMKSVESAEVSARSNRARTWPHGGALDVATLMHRKNNFI
jgi:hypothetical protein